MGSEPGPPPGCLRSQRLSPQPEKRLERPTESRGLVVTASPQVRGYLSNAALNIPKYNCASPM